MPAHEARARETLGDAAAGDARTTTRFLQSAPPSRPAPALETAALASTVLELRLKECVQPVADILLIMAANIFVGDDGNHLLQAGFEFGARFRRVELARVDLAAPEHFGKRLCLAHHLVEGGAALMAHQIVRILAVGQQRKTHGAAGFQVRQRQIRRPVGGADAGAVAIEAEHRLRRHFPKQLELVFGERRAKRRHRVLDASLMQGDDIHIAFDGDDRALAVRALRRSPGARKIVEHVALVKELGLVGIEIFRRRIRRHGASAEGDHLLPRREDGEHDAVAETVVTDRHFGPMNDKAAGLDLLLGDTLAGQELLERVAAVRRKAQAEGLDRAARQPAVAKIGARPRAVCRLQLVLKERASPVP